MNIKTLWILLIVVSLGPFSSSILQAWDYPDPTYGTSDPPNYKKKSSKKKKGSHESPYVYSSRFNDPYYGSSNPPGYNEKKAKKLGKTYIPPRPEPLPPIYGTGVPKKSSSRKTRN